MQYFTYVPIKNNSESGSQSSERNYIFFFGLNIFSILFLFIKIIGHKQQTMFYTRETADPTQLNSFFTEFLIDLIYLFWN